jgi:Na+-driven multidrug efflux pump
LNISLDYVFMALLAMGIGGAAFATVLSQGVSAYLTYRHILHKKRKRVNTVIETFSR